MADKAPDDTTLYTCVGTCTDLKHDQVLTTDDDITRRTNAPTGTGRVAVMPWRRRNMCKLVERQHACDYIPDTANSNSDLTNHLTTRVLPISVRTANASATNTDRTATIAGGL